MTKHETYMRRAIELALRGAGMTSPNPMVGAVIVKGGKVVGEGFHRKAGESHAEINALSEAGRVARGADLYVTLEPCCHEGKTPPCVDAIRDAGIARVIVGTIDPNPRVNGKGMRCLKSSGIEVIDSVMEDSCRAMNEVYNKYIISGMPFITAKVALTLDGKIAATSGHSRWITNASCRNYVHGLRAISDAVMVGGGTVRRDDPRLDARLKGVRQALPKAVVVDEELNLPRASRLFKRRSGDLICITTRKAKPSRVKWIQSKGHEVIFCKATSKGMVDIPSALEELGRRGIVSVLLEGGGHMFTTFVKGDLVDRMIACIAPKLVGGDGFDFLPGIGAKVMGDAIDLCDINVMSFDDNIVIEGYPSRR